MDFDDSYFQNSSVGEQRLSKRDKRSANEAEMANFAGDRGILNLLGGGRRRTFSNFVMEELLFAALFVWVKIFGKTELARGR